MREGACMCERERIWDAGMRGVIKSEKYLVFLHHAAVLTFRAMHRPSA